MGHATVAAVTGAIKGGMWSRQLQAIGEEGNRRPGRWLGMQAHNAVRRALLDVGVARMVNGTELHLLHMRPEDNKLTLAGKHHRCSGTRASSTTPRRGYCPIVVSSYA